jgi:ribose transport system ATP-binding protein
LIGSQAGATAPNALELRSVSKTFGSQVALDSVDLTVKVGEIHALVGQNGSGKSTIVKLLAGYHAPDKGGQALANDQVFHLGSMAAAHDAGLRFVHQDLGLIEHFTVAENFCMSSPDRGWVRPLTKREERYRTSRAISDFGYKIDPACLVATLSAAQRTAVAIVRALKGDAPPAVLVLDEPTASLAGPDAELLFDALRRLAERGSAVLFVSHHLDEVIGLADSVTVLRDGQHIATASSSVLSHDHLAELMLGRSMSPRAATPVELTGEKASRDSGPRLTIRDLHGMNMRGITIEAEPGEIVGVAGLTGSGREDIAGAVAGQGPRSGLVAIDNAALKAASPRDAMARGLAYAPAHRRRDGLLGGASLSENLTLADLRSVCRRGRINRRLERREAHVWMETLDVRPREEGRHILEFSGGNQQKVVLGRLLRTEPSVLVLDEPTQGIDIGAKAAIHDLIGGVAATGATVLMCSSDVDELVRVATRVVVLRRGIVGAELAGSELTVNRIEEELLRPACVDTTAANGVAQRNEAAHA